MVSISGALPTAARSKPKQISMSFCDKVVLVDQHLADLVGGVGVFALVGVVVLKQELAVGVFDDTPGAGLGVVSHGER
jgi:hypothetical protein